MLKGIVEKMNTTLKEKGSKNLIEKPLVDLIEFIQNVFGKELVKREILESAYESNKAILK